ncbi:metabolite traffic protein EboE [Fulvivirgaceae bacterium BMA10]|uniref:Metabolite traffic protein EboE n=1 Tax=Splendidivirga corallicola TaxID=3051826 RepID=A0ABT8KHZ8_9BACT|nr:metabolite traffic protein EboE [Fulvivirgaceae bacterium BMA10]
MIVSDHYHLSYCTNIHPGETWPEVFDSLKAHLPQIKQNISPDNPFGIGLRLSDLASRQLLEDHHLASFKDWLEVMDCYVYTMNGFPFGGFHRQVVKDDVHKPDWTTRSRVDYTKRLFTILAELLPKGIDGGISTSPLSYKHWFSDDPKELDDVFEVSTRHLVEIAAFLNEIKKQKGVSMHLDIEPEPDGLIENSQEVIDYYSKWLIPFAMDHLAKDLNVAPDKAIEIVREHIQVCYDVCHFAVGYEEPSVVFDQFREHNIKIGKIQISAALKADLPKDVIARQPIEEAFAAFNESTYLHQVIAREENGGYTQYNDLPRALENINNHSTLEWRTHFHVPIFVEAYGYLKATQEDIRKVLELLKQMQVTNHLEVETYTWEVLPEDLRTDLSTSIQREVQWVLNEMNG